MLVVKTPFCQAFSSTCHDWLQASPWSGNDRPRQEHGKMVGRHSSMPTSGLAENSSLGSFRKSFKLSLGYHNHSRPVRRFFKETIFAPSSGTTTNSTSPLPSA